jgi:hypothetical protein
MASVGSVLLYPLGFVVFLAPGLPAVCALVRRRSWPAYWIVPLTVVISSAAGAVVFWAYFLHPTTGRVASAAILAISAVCLWPLARPGPIREMVRQPDVVRPLVLMFLIGLSYFGIAGILLATTGGGTETAAGDLFSNMYLANDNFISWYFAEHLYAGTDPRQLLGDWHSSDRPPLQTGLVLVQRPLADFSPPPIVQYQILGTVFQCSWVPAVWALGRELRCDAWRLGVVLAFCATASFFVFHSLYVWPKLLAGTLTIVAVLLLVRPKSPAGWVEVLAAGLSAGLALLAHAGAAFALFGLAIVLLWPNYFPGLAKVVAGLAVCVAVVAPWIAYQRWYDPPGNRLLKWHLTGTVAIDDRPFTEAFVEAYAALSPAELAHNKWANAQALVGRPWIEPTYSGDGLRAAWKNGEYYNLIKALGVLNAGWVVMAISWFGRGPSNRFREARTFVAVGLAGLAVWLVLMFGPGTTQIYQGAFGTFMLLFVTLAAAVSTLPRPVVVGFLGVQVLDLIMTWVIP